LPGGDVVSLKAGNAYEAEITMKHAFRNRSAFEASFYLRETHQNTDFSEQKMQSVGLMFVYSHRFAD
jgi:hypothetical protein